MLLRAFAKINLVLRVGALRPDGFHEVRTVFQTIDWHDEIQLEPATQFRFSSNAPPQDQSNLVVRAARMFEEAAGVVANVGIHLEKRLPVGAGLGGGSADAAVTFLGLMKLYDVRMPLEKQRDALRSLGSDVPFFALGGRAFGIGRGDEISPLEDITDYWLVVVPGVSVRTREAYSWLTTTERPVSIEGFCAQFLSSAGEEPLVNDFERPVYARYPELQQIKEALLDHGAFDASLSGSGSAIFGQFRSEEQARSAMAMLAVGHPATLARPLSRQDYWTRLFDK